MTHKVLKPWGDEEWLCNTPLYCGKFLRVKRCWRCSLHYHERKDETFYVLYGQILLEYGGSAEHLSRTTLSAGETFRVFTGTLHRFTGLEHSIILEISTHHDDADVIRLEQSGEIQWP